MKTLSWKIKRVFTVAVVIIAVAFTGCQYEYSDLNPESTSEVYLKSTAADEFEWFGEAVKCQSKELIWEKQLSLVMQNKAPDNHVRENGLILENYRYKGVIGSISELEKVKEEIISDAVLPVYHSKSSFEICKNDDVSPEFLKEVLDGLIPTSKHVVLAKANGSKPLFQCLFEAGDMGIVELEWSYNGKKLNTIALVSDKKGVVYDNLLYSLHFSSAKEKTEISAADGSKTLRLKSGNENNADGSYLYSFICNETGYNSFGGLLYTYDIKLSVSFSRIGGQVYMGSDLSYSSFADGNLGWSAVASIQVISFVPDDGGHVHYAWAYAYKFGWGLSLTFQGIGFTVSGGGTSGQGGHYFDGK